LHTSVDDMMIFVAPRATQAEVEAAVQRADIVGEVTVEPDDWPGFAWQITLWYYNDFDRIVSSIRDSLPHVRVATLNELEAERTGNPFVEYL